MDGITNGHVSPQQGEGIYLADTGAQIGTNKAAYVPPPFQEADKDLALLSGERWMLEILEVGKPLDLMEFQVGDPAQKYGARSGYTRGIVEEIGVTVAVNYGFYIAFIRDCVVIRGESGPFMQPGDSGSLIENMAPAVGAHGFAGNEQERIGIGYNALRLKELGYRAAVPTEELPKRLRVEWDPNGLRISQE